MIWHGGEGGDLGSCSKEVPVNSMLTPDRVWNSTFVRSGEAGLQALQLRLTAFVFTTTSRLSPQALVLAPAPMLLNVSHRRVIAVSETGNWENREEDDITGGPAKEVCMKDKICQVRSAWTEFEQPT